MKYIFKIFCLIFLFISEYIFTVGNAQAQVLVQLRQPPRYQFKIEDMWKVTLNNTTQTTYNVFLYGIATKSGEGKIVDANTATFRLPPGVKVISGHDVSPINVIETNKNYEDAVKYTGGVPTGNYEICVSVYNADNNEVLGSECIEQSVEIISGIELLLPEDKSLVLNGPEDVETEYQKHDWNKEVKTGKAGLTDAEYDHVKPPPPVPPNLNINNVNGSFITFSWIVPSPAPRGGNLTYTLTLTEMLGRQSAYDAIESNPAFFKSANLIATTYQYPSISRGFVSGKRYAWKVTAYLNGVKMTESEINEFSYRDNNLQTFTKNGKTKVWRHEGMSWLTSEIDKSSIYDLKLNEGVGSSPLLKTKSPILFYGSSTLEGVNSNRKGTGSDLPQRYANLTLTPSIAFYGLPFSTSILLSTLGTSNMQNVNSYSIGFDPATLKDMIQKRVDNEIDKAKTQIEQKVKEKSDSYRKELENQMIGLNYDTLKLKNDIKYQKDNSPALITKFTAFSASN